MPLCCKPLHPMLQMANEQHEPMPAYCSCCKCFCCSTHHRHTGCSTHLQLQCWLLSQRHRQLLVPLLHPHQHGHSQLHRWPLLLVLRLLVLRLLVLVLQASCPLMGTARLPQPLSLVCGLAAV